MNFDKLKKIGEAHEYKNFLIFFGTKAATLELLTAYIPGSRSLKQVHGDKLVQWSPGNKVTDQEGDAHSCGEKNHALLIKSADCLPVMICSPQKGIALGIHAGWRGVEKKITSKSVAALQLQDDKDLKVFIGPHIQQKSFEVDKDVATEILTAHGFDLQTAAVVFEKNGKYHINLSSLVKSELQALGIADEQISVSPRDTKSEDAFYSYRRGEKGVRNYSFILRTK